MRNIEKNLLRAKKHCLNWQKDYLIDTVLFIAKKLQLSYDWDEGAGEGWVSFIEQDKRAAMISSVIPFVIVKECFFINLADLTETVEVIPVKDFEKKCLSCSIDIMKQVFSLDDISEQFNGAGFSAETLWWSTI